MNCGVGQMNDLIFIYDDNNVFTDHSIKTNEFLRDDLSVDYVGGEDAIYVGLYKPFDTFYLELSEIAVGAPAFSYGYYNGTTYAPASQVKDDTSEWTRSGFISFDRPSDWTLTTVNGVEAYWLRIEANANFTAVIRGLNLVFADDLDLEKEMRDINRYLEKGDSSFIAYHVSARDEIMQTLKNGGYIKHLCLKNKIENASKWDLLEVGEVRQASKYMALSKIMFDVSQQTDDKYYQRHIHYTGMFGKAFDLYKMTFDSNDNGIIDDSEGLAVRAVKFNKV